MKVVIITNIPAPYRVDLFNFLKNERNIDITVLYSSQTEDNRTWKVENIQHDNIVLKSRTIKIKKKLDYKYIHIPSDVLRVLNNINPDIIVASEYNPTVCLGYIWAKCKQKKFISWSDGTLNSESDISKIQKIIRRNICKNSDALIASSTKTKEAQISYGANPKNIFISYLTVDISKYFTERKRDKIKNITFVGRLVKTKGLDLLIDAIELVTGDYKVNVIGDGPEYTNIFNICKSKRIDDKFIFHGNKDREFIINIYAKTDIFILPSRKECFGLVITEAMCAGTPIIASKYVDGAYDLIEDGVNGFIIDPRDKVSFANKIQYLLDNYNENTNMGKKSIERVSKLSIESVSKNFVKAIEYVI